MTYVSASSASHQHPQGLPVKHVAAHHHQQHYLHHEQQQQHSSSLPTNCSRPASAASSRAASGSVTIAKVVNPLGTVTTVSNAGPDGSEPSAAAAAEVYMHENCDEALFRPVVTVHGTPGDADRERRGSSLDRLTMAVIGADGPAATLVSRDLIVPVIEEKDMVYFSKPKKKDDENAAKFEELSSINKKCKRDEPEIIESVPETTDRNMAGDFVNIEVVERRTEEPKSTGSSGKKKEKTPPPAGRSESRKKSAPEPIEVIEIVEPMEELELPPVEKVPRNNGKKNGKKKEEPKPQPNVDKPPKAKSPPAETKPSRSAPAGNNNSRKDNKQDNRRRKEKQTAAPAPPAPPAEPEPEPEVVRPPSPPPPAVVVVEEEILKSICDEFPPLEALKIDDLELFGESNEPENLKLTRADISVQESMLASGMVVTAVEPGDGGAVELSQAGDEDDSKCVDQGVVKCDGEEVSELEFEDPKRVAKEEEFYEISTRYELQFSEAMPPLEPFVCKDFEDLGFSENVKKKKAMKQSSEEKTLINFESPLQEEAKEVPPSKSKSILDDRNIVFAMCSSLREATPSEMGESSGGSKGLSTSMTTRSVQPADLKQQLSVEGQDSDYKSLELEVDDSAMFTSQLPTSSASDEDTSNSNNDEQEEEVKQTGKIEDEDEELQPLISSGRELTDSLSGSMTTSGIVAAVGSSAKTPTSTSATTTATTSTALPTTEANQSEDSGKQTTTGKQTSNNGGNNGNGKKKSKKKRK